MAAFSYYNRDRNNIRSVREWGGGALMDIGCYAVQIARFFFGDEPVRVTGAIERDPELGIDRLTSGLLQFRSGHCVFTCSTQMVPYQRVQILCSKGRIEVEVPFNAPPDRPCRLLIDNGADLFGSSVQVEEIPTCDQYTIQGDRFSEAILNNTDVPTPLEDSIRNLAVIEALFRTAEP
jgi:predicted dehydrogenase